MQFPSLNQPLDLKQEQQKQRDKLRKQPEPFTSAYFTDFSREKQIIDEAFSANNYTYLRKLPDFIQRLNNHIYYKKINHYQISKEKKLTQIEFSRIKTLSCETSRRFYSKENINLGGYFSAFEYIPTDYDYVKQLRYAEQLQHQDKVKQVADKEFVPVKNICKLKHEDPFNFSLKNEKYIFPFYLPEDCYNLTQESQMRQRVIEEAKILSGSFLPPGKKRPYSKSDLQDIIHILKEIIVSDWPDASVMLGVTDKDTIEVLFVMYYQVIIILKSRSLSCQLGLLTAYMNSLLNDERVAHFQLSRVIELWAVKRTEEGIIIFTIKPPWVRLKQ